MHDTTPESYGADGPEEPRAYPGHSGLPGLLGDDGVPGLEGRRGEEASPV